MTTWSIEQELHTAGGTDDLEAALLHLGILAPEERLAQIRVEKDWVRGGNETYVFEFSVRTLTGREVPLILKAFTPAFSATTLTEALDRIMQRRGLLTSYGIKAPKVYFVQGATWLEDRIPFDLGQRIDMLSQDEQRRRMMLVQLFMLAIAFDELGFDPVAPFNDLRTDDADIYVIDFGVDMGPPFVRRSVHQVEDRLVVWLQKVAGIDLAADELTQVKSIARQAFANRLRTVSRGGKVFYLLSGGGQEGGGPDTVP